MLRCSGDGVGLSTALGSFSTVCQEALVNDISGLVGFGAPLLGSGSWVALSLRSPGRVRFEFAIAAVDLEDHGALHLVLLCGQKSALDISHCLGRLIIWIISNIGGLSRLELIIVSARWILYLIIARDNWHKLL